MNRVTVTVLLFVLIVVELAGPSHADTLAQHLSGAKPGAVVTLPAGVFKVNGDAIPAGITLRGAGYRKTILDATGSIAGITVGGLGTTVTDLTVRGASGSALSVTGATNIKLERLRIVGSGIGVKLHAVADGTIDNIVSARNKIGFILSKSTGTSIVNCSAVNNTVTSIGVSGNNHCAIFNDLFVGAPTGIGLGTDNSLVLIDHNFYVASFTGKFGVQPARRSVASWSQCAGVDSHSASLAVDFADPANDICRPITPVSWRPTAAVTSGWGVASMETFAAPTSDIDGKSRGAVYDAGAYQVSFPAPRDADGTFKVQSSDGVKSAGLYDRNNRQICPLFNNQPLPKGTYSFWLPSHGTTGKAIPAGAYQVRVAESNLSLSYVGMTGNGGLSPDILEAASLGPERALFDTNGRIVLAQTGVENNQQLRSFEPGLGHGIWAVPGGSDCRGLVQGDGGRLFMLNEMDAAGTARMSVVDPESGKLLPLVGDRYGETYTGVFSPSIAGMAALGGKLYVADTAKNTLMAASQASPTSWTAIAIPTPSEPASDRAHSLLWVISGGVVVAFDPDNGAVKGKIGSLGAVPTSLSISGDLLAVCSTAARKVFVYDISSIDAPKLLRTIGTGESPYGPLKPARLLTPTNAAISTDGSVLVVDWFRASLFDPIGAVVKSEMGNWGQRITLAKFAGDDRQHVFNLGAQYTFALDPKTRTWQPDMAYHIPVGLVKDGYFPLGFYSSKGKNYGVFPGKVDGGDAVNVAQIVGSEMKWLISYSFDAKAGSIVMRTDANSDGVIDASDPSTKLVDDRGQPLPNLIPSVFGVHPDGSLMAVDSVDPGAVAVTIPVDPSTHGYNWSGRQPVVAKVDTDNSFTSPYDLKTVEHITPITYTETATGYTAGILLKSGGGAGFSGGSTDLVGLDSTGKMRWFYPINPPPAGRGIGVRALQSVAGITLCNDTTEDEFNALDDDGLGLGLMGPPVGQHWLGMWVDGDAQVRTFTGDDGQPYVLVGDYATQAVHWMALNGARQITRTVVDVAIDAATADKLGALPPLPLPPMPAKSMPVPSVLIEHLAAPLTIDGDPQKWRTAGIEPQIVMTPDSGSGFNGPKDCSAVIRLAYEGNNLYVQCIRFDDVVTFHQPLSMFYKADALEMEINGFFSGYKYAIARTTDKGDVINREEFLIPSATLLLDPAKAPLSIKVYDNARDFPERKIFEDVYGVDMSDSKVVVTEFKLPMDYAYGQKLPFKMEPGGGTFWLGFFVDDNDVPGSDTQRFLPWPATFLVFLNPDQGALASFE